MLEPGPNDTDMTPKSTPRILVPDKKHHSISRPFSYFLVQRALACSIFDRNEPHVRDIRASPISTYHGLSTPETHMVGFQLIPRCFYMGSLWWCFCGRNEHPNNPSTNQDQNRTKVDERYYLNPNRRSMNSVSCAKTRFQWFLKLQPVALSPFLFLPLI